MKSFKIVIISLVSLLVLLVLGWGLGWYDVFYQGTIGKAQINIQRENFEHSKSYVQGMVNDLAKYKYEISLEKDPIARKAIVDLIISKYGNFDVNLIDNPDLHGFLLDIRNGIYNN